MATNFLIFAPCFPSETIAGGRFKKYTLIDDGLPPAGQEKRKKRDLTAEQKRRKQIEEAT